MNGVRHDVRQYGITLWHCLTCPNRPTLHGLHEALAHESER